MVEKGKIRVSIVIPVYKPNEKIFEKVKAMIKKQTVKSEIIEMWNNPEAVSLNKGIKKAKGEIVVTLAQDCVPHGNRWLEKLIKPLEDEKVSVSVSDLNLPKEFWKNEYSFLTRMLSISELGVRRPMMDARACAYRKKDLIELGLFNEDPKTVAIDADLYMKLIKKGKVVHPGSIVDHLHHLSDERKIKMIYNYAEANGKLVKLYGTRISFFWSRFIRAIPFLGLFPLFIFPAKNHADLFPGYVLISLFPHLIYIYGFWKGFLFDRESMRNKEVLNGKK
tara:strand:- start:9519 stop:10355 length:837 start_codon:yes stop_codon:yes gene_type:complete